MRIAVFGLGYVGTVTGACLAHRGHSVVGVDVQAEKVEAFDGGRSPVVEPRVEELLAEAKERGLLRATVTPADAVAASELSLVCVGTPSTLEGSLDLRFVDQVLGQIGDALREAPGRHAVVIRSTLLPGTTASLVADRLSHLGEESGAGVYYYPEFLREGSAVDDFLEPSVAVVGTRDGSPPPARLRERLFGERARVVTWAVAELVKYASNAFHASKITFANEIGRLAKRLEIDSREVMEILCSDRKLNLSAQYLRPGNPFGGSCLPKDLRALVRRSRELGVELPMTESLLGSNRRHVEGLLALVTATGERQAVILGLAFKPETDDLRESAMVEVAQTLLGRGYELRIYDPTLNLRRLVGSNKRLIEAKMPHLASLLYEDLESAVGDGGVILAAHRVAPMDELARCVTARHHIVDVNGWPELASLPAVYEGLCW